MTIFVITVKKNTSLLSGIRSIVSDHKLSLLLRAVVNILLQESSSENPPYNY